MVIGNLRRGFQERRHDFTIIHLPVEDIGFEFDENLGTILRETPRHWVVVVHVPVDGEELRGLNVGGLSKSPGDDRQLGDHSLAACQVYVAVGNRTGTLYLKYLLL